MLSISNESRTEPSVMKPTPPRFAMRVIRISPAEAALPSPRESTTMTCPGPIDSTANLCGCFGSLNASTLSKSSRAGMYLRVNASPTKFLWLGVRKITPLRN